MVFRIQNRGRRFLVLAVALVMLLALIASLAGWALGAVRPRGIGVGGICLAFSRRDMEIAIANQRVQRDPANHNPSTWFFPAHSARVAMPSSSGWRPRQHRASMTIGTPAGAMVTLNFRVIVMPAWIAPVTLWLPIALLLPLGLRGPPNGRCRRCGYDLAGLENGPCPECGRTDPRSRRTVPSPSPTVARATEQTYT